MARKTKSDYDKLAEQYRILSKIFRDEIVAKQAAWIEWRHGRGAEEAMQWIENGLAGPGQIPRDDEPYVKEAQAWYDANKSDPFPKCHCGRPSSTMWGNKGACSEAHYQEAKKLEKH